MTEHKLSPVEAQTLADATAEAMYSRDRAAQALGIKIVRVQPGASLLTMTVRGDMVNGHHICHGGMIFSLADTAFAYACNSYNKSTVASACHIDFLAPALNLPDWVHQLALTSHLGQSMIGVWDPVGMATCLVLAVGGLLIGGLGMRRRDVQ